MKEGCLKTPLLTVMIEKFHALSVKTAIRLKIYSG